MKTWPCENEEVDALVAFLVDEVPPAGRYRLIRSGSPAAEVLAALGEDTDVAALADALSERVDTRGLMSALAASKHGLSAAEGAVVAQRRALVESLREIVSGPITTETDLQRQIGDAYWLFGGRYVGIAPRRAIASRSSPQPAAPRHLGQAGGIARSDVRYRRYVASHGKCTSS